MLFGRCNHIFCAGWHPRGGGGVLSYESRINTDNSGSQTLSAEEQQTADLISGNIKLDPENDPVICTTESGLEIKYAMAINLGTGTQYETDASIPAGSATSPSGLSGYAYLKMGNYNWIIIGYNTSSTSTTVNYNYNGTMDFATYLASPSSYKSFAGSFEKSSDAGLAISNAGSNGLMWANYALSVALSYSKAVKNTSELNSGEALVFCQSIIGEKTVFSSSQYSTNYNGSTLQSVIRNLYYPSTSKNEAGFTTGEAALIVPKTLKSLAVYDGTSLVSHTEYLFPLASNWKYTVNESFRIIKYLPTSSDQTYHPHSCSRQYWLRSAGNGQYYVSTISSTGAEQISRPNVSYYVRPAMVIKI